MRFGHWKQRAVILVSYSSLFKVLLLLVLLLLVDCLVAAKARVASLTAALQAVATQTKVAWMQRGLQLKSIIRSTIQYFGRYSMAKNRLIMML